MTLDTATGLILATTDTMNRAYQRTVFDELAIVAMQQGKLFLVWYSGPRPESFPKSFHRDTAALKAETRNRFSSQYHIGDFEFTAAGAGAQSEAFLVVGEHLHLICGHTVLSMAEIAKDRRWLAAQRPFVELSEKFRLDPLMLAGPPSGPEITPA